MNNEKRLRPGNIFLTTLIVYAMVPISGLATDIYLPSMPPMASEFHTSQERIQLTLSIFLICYGVAQVIAGIFLDAFGRYKISVAALGIFSLSSIMVATTHNLMVIYAMRMVQGVCTAFTIVAGRAFFTDVYEGDKRRNYLSLMTIVWSAGPIVAPFAGGYLEHLFGWRSNFYALAVYSFLLFIAQLIFSGETVKNRLKLNFQPVFKSYSTILSARDFISGILLLGISYAMIMLFSLSGAFIIEHKMGYSPVVAGYVSLILGLAWMCGGFAGKALISKRFITKNTTALIIQTLLIIGMVATSSLYSNLWTLVSFAFIVHVTAGFIFNNFYTYCLSRFPQFAGIAGGLTGGLAYSLTAILSYGLIALIKPESQQAIGAGYFIIALFGLTVLWLSRRVYQPD